MIVMYELDLSTNRANRIDPSPLLPQIPTYSPFEAAAYIDTPVGPHNIPALNPRDRTQGNA